MFKEMALKFLHFSRLFLFLQPSCSYALTVPVYYRQQAGPKEADVTHQEFGKVSLHSHSLSFSIEAMAASLLTRLSLLAS